VSHEWSMEGGLRSHLPVETKTCFPISDGRELRLDRGRIDCEVHYSRIPHELTHDDWDTVRCELLLFDREGQGFRLERRLAANCFLELVSLSRRPPQDISRLLVAGVRCYHDHRVWIPATALGAGGMAPVVFYAKQLDVVLDLVAFTWGHGEALAIRVHPWPYGGIDGKATPLVCADCDWAAKIVVWPSLIGSHGPVGEPPVFAPADLRGTPQALVTAG
jgi:hypothetical protein